MGESRKAAVVSQVVAFLMITASVMAGASVQGWADPTTSNTYDDEVVAHSGSGAQIYRLNDPVGSPVTAGYTPYKATAPALWRQGGTLGGDTRACGPNPTAYTDQGCVNAETGGPGGYGVLGSCVGSDMYNPSGLNPPETSTCNSSEELDFGGAGVWLNWQGANGGSPGHGDILSVSVGNWNGPITCQSGNSIGVNQDGSLSGSVFTGANGVGGSQVPWSTSAGTLTAGSWAYLVMTATASGLWTIYVNGQSVAAVSGGSSPHVGEWGLGQWFAGNPYNCNGGAWGDYSEAWFTRGSYSASAIATDYMNMTGAAAPGAPQNVSASGGNASASVSWNPPPSTFPAITSFTVTAITNGAASARQTVCGTCLSATFTALTNGQTYAFGVYATNDIGDGPVAYSNYVQPPAPGAAPIPNCAPNQLPDFGLPCTVVPDPAPVPPPPPQPPVCGAHSPPIPANVTLDAAVRFLPSSSQSALGGIYASISDSVPYVDPATNPPTSAWVMMQVPYQKAEYAQAGWFQYPAGDAAGRTKTAFTETDGAPDSTVIGTGKVHWETDYNIPSESAYYSVQLRRGIQDNIIAPIDPGNGLNRYFFYRNGNLLGSPMVLEASLVLSWAVVAGEIHGPLVGGLYQPSTSRMPGTVATPQTFSDIHIYYTPNSGAPGWQHWGGPPDSIQNQDSGDSGASVGTDSFQIWDKTC